jgi:hypothetical protein
MKIYRSSLPIAVLHSLPSGSGQPTYPVWAANHVGLEQILGVAGFLDPEFYEVKGHVFWDWFVAERREERSVITTPFGNDPRTVERYYNIVNLDEFFLLSFDEAVQTKSAIEIFGQVIEHFWGIALKMKFPERVYRFEIAPDLFDE